MPEAEIFERRFEASDAAARAARAAFAREAPSVFHLLLSPGSSLLRSPVEGDVTFEAQGRLDAETAVLGFELLEEEVVCWAITPDGMLLNRLAISPERLAAWAASVLDSCVKGSLAANSELAPLGDAVLGWADGLLETTERLLLVPTGALRTIPFTVLPWRGRPLRHQPHVLRAAARWASSPIWRLEPARSSRGESHSVWKSRGNVLDVAERRGRADGWTQVRGRGVEGTAEELAGERGVAHTGPAATRQAVVDALREADIVHIAAHARFCAEAPLFSAILLAHGEQLSTIDLIATDAKCDLIVASACGTGRGVPTTADDVLGLSRGLLACGARAAVVSLWPVDDRRTSELIGRLLPRDLRWARPCAGAAFGATRLPRPRRARAVRQTRRRAEAEGAGRGVWQRALLGAVRSCRRLRIASEWEAVTSRSVV